MTSGKRSPVPAGGAAATPGSPVADSRRTSFLLLVLVVLVPLSFAQFTGNIWEDFFITFRCSLNLVHGHGLVYEAGRRVHAFTSPLGVLVPAALSWMFGTDDPLIVLAVFRTLAAAALALAWAQVAGRLPGLAAVIVAGALWVFDPKLAAFSTNGMETAFLIFFVTLAWRSLVDGRVDLAGLALGGSMWTRPDGFIFVGAIAAGVWLFPGPAKIRVRDWLRMGIIAGLIYAPWFVWAWVYYGSPVPNTILAKGALLQPRETLQLLLSYPVRYFFGRSVAQDAFLPAYFFFGGWPAGLWWYGKAITLAVAACTFWPRCDRAARVAGIGFLLGGVYLTMTTRAPWYFPAWQVLAYVALAGGVAAAGESFSGQRVGRWLLITLASGLVAVQAWMLVASAVQLRAQQRIIEWGSRAAIGRDLRRAAGGSKDTVFLEPLGYIGFYSGLAMRDTPGLCAPEVTALRKAGTHSMAGLIAALRPDWAVLRVSEYAGMSSAERPAFDHDYELRSTYDTRGKIAAIGWLPGRDFLQFDSFFTVWKRRAPAKALP